MMPFLGPGIREENMDFIDTSRTYPMFEDRNGIGIEEPNIFQAEPYRSYKHISEAGYVCLYQQVTVFRVPLCVLQRGVGAATAYIDN